MRGAPCPPTGTFDPVLAPRTDATLRALTGDKEDNMMATDFAPRLVTLEERPVAVLRETVPMTALTEYFGRAFQAVPAVLGRQQIAITGPPIAVYLGTPTDTADVAAGFPSASEVAADDGVTPFRLPGGAAARVIHHGSYDSLGETYGLLFEWLGQQGLAPGTLMWESYLNEPEPNGDPAALLTEITWPVTEAPGKRET